ncbi:unnamed protein product [Mytilus coruscus]|uniref:Retropepsins domain-containing protein n=1 Tax=Mytilus coruscus TaxID=42192 RepID=A0A6J8EUJ2_MYTCO|nr:unnamed protein product [Mytilus coruscus]
MVASHLQQASLAYHRSSTTENLVKQHREIYKPDTPTVERVQPFPPLIQHDDYHCQPEFNRPVHQTSGIQSPPPKSHLLVEHQQTIHVSQQHYFNKYQPERLPSDHVHFSSSAQHTESYLQQGYNNPHQQGQSNTSHHFQSSTQGKCSTAIPSPYQYQLSTSNTQGGVNRVQQPLVQSQTYVPSHQQVPKQQQHQIGSINQQPSVNKVQQPLLPAQKGVQMQQQVQGLQQRIAQIQLGVNNYVQPVQQQYPGYQPPSFVPRTQPTILIGHPTSLFQPPRGGPPPQAPTQSFNQQHMSSVTYPQQPPSSGAPQAHNNQPSARRKEYNSDYYERQRRLDPGRSYTADSDTSDTSQNRQTSNKRRSEPAYLSDHSRRDFSPIRSARTSPAHSRHSPRRSLTARESQSESETDSRHSRSLEKKKKIEKRQFLSSIPRTLRYKKQAASNSPVVLGVGSSKSSIDNRLSRMEEYMEKMMSTVTSLVQEQSVKQGTSPSSRSSNQDNRSSNYSPRRNYGRGRGRGNNSGDRRYTRRDCPDLYVQDTGSRQSVQKETISQQVSFNENSKDDFYESEGVVSGISTMRSLGAVKLFRVEVDIAGKKVLALVYSGSEVTILKDTIFDTLEPNPYVIRETTMHGAGTNMTMPCRLTSPIKFKIGHMQFNQQLYIAPVSCDIILGCDFIIQNRAVMNIGELIITVQNRNMPLILEDENTAHEPNVNVVHEQNTSDSSSDEKPSIEGSTQRFTASGQSANFHYETVIPQVESNLGMMASTSTQESAERRIQEKSDQCRANRNKCCINKVETRENLGFYTSPKSGKKKNRTDRKYPVQNWPVVVDRRDIKRHCFEEHLSEIFQTYHSRRLMKDSRFHQHRASVVMLIGKWLSRQEKVTAKELVNFLNEKSYVPRSTHVTGIQMQIHRTPCLFTQLESPNFSSSFLPPEQQEMVAEGFNYNPRNPPEPEELAEMNAIFWPVSDIKTQDESAILQREGEEDNVVSEQEERTIVMDEKEEIHYESENLNVSSTSLVENKQKEKIAVQFCRQ